MNGESNWDDVISRHLSISTAMAARGWAVVDPETAERAAAARIRGGTGTRPGFPVRDATGDDERSPDRV